MSNMSVEPLAGVRVIEMTNGRAEICGRFLADLGADVILVEPPEGSAARDAEPVYGGTSLYFATRNANKRSVVLDTESASDRERLLELLDDADIWIETMRPGTLEPLGLGPDAVLARNAGLVIASLTDFGQTGPYRDYVGTEWVQMAMAGMLSRSGLPGRAPLLPPGRLATDSAALQAAWTILVAYMNRLDTGRGDHLDFSIYEATAQCIDPGFGTGGTSQGMGANPSNRGRPDGRHLYPIFECADGHVRICVLSARQWRGLFEWMGEPAEFADPKYASLIARFKASRQIFAMIGELFREQTVEAIVDEGQRRGVPVAGLSTPADVLVADHFLSRGVFVDVPIKSGEFGRAPFGCFELDGERPPWRRPAPGLGEHGGEVFAELGQARDRPEIPKGSASRRHPLEGLKVIDLGVIVLGAEESRLLADQGADVMKVENRAFPDGGRQSLTGEDMTPTVAWGHRNKRSLGLNLRDPSGKGKKLLERLIAGADVILSNFKPGTMESLGLGAKRMLEINPGIVIVESSAQGANGPWSQRLGYGPLVRASTGMTALWRYPEDEEGFSDAVTIYPDHHGARIGAAVVLAMLIRRRGTGQGGVATISQAEAILDGLAEYLLLESLEPGAAQAGLRIESEDAPQGLYRCAGEDEWCIVTLRGDDEWAGLCQAIGRPDLAEDPRLATTQGRLRHHAEVDAAVSAWMKSMPPRKAAATLQEAGVPAGFMQRVDEYPEDPQLLEREFLSKMEQPGLSGPLLVERRPCLSRGLADPELRPAPRAFEHTRELCREWLGMNNEEIERLIDEGVLELADGEKRS
jgi:crotonobetainyl-CoA:carnitine CoA-transferase CaiB-like acyl-CoA transferase